MEELITHNPYGTLSAINLSVPLSTVPQRASLAIITVLLTAMAYSAPDRGIHEVAMLNVDILSDTKPSCMSPCRASALVVSVRRVPYSVQRR